MSTLLTSGQAGQLLGKSARTVVRMAERGELEVAQKLPGDNGARLFELEEVQRLAAELVLGKPKDPGQTLFDQNGGEPE
jgi:hypothetical protein